MTPGKRTFKLVLVGIGGQGILTAGRMIGDAAMHADMQVALGQLHGMSQKGGAVECTAVIGRARTGFVGKGQADCVLAFEPFETLRAIERMSPSTRVVVNRHPIVPYSLTLAGDEYPEISRIAAVVRTTVGDARFIDATELAERAGDARTVGAVMLGALAGLDILPFDARVLRAAVGRLCPKKAREANFRAFDSGAAIAAAPADTGHLDVSESRSAAP